MGFLKKLFAKRPKIKTEWQGEAFEVALYPLEGLQAERESLLVDDRRRRWVWVDLSLLKTGEGKFALVASAQGKKLGEIPHRYRNARNNADAFEAVARGVDTATVRLSMYDGEEGGTTATLKFGEHKYMPKRPHLLPPIE